MIIRSVCVWLTTVTAFLVCTNLVGAGDWPQWRYDAGRTASSPDELPATLQLQWGRQLPSPRPAWPASQPSLRFDASYEPVAAGKLLYVPSMVTDTVTAYDTQTGRQVWQFFAEGPVRLAPSYFNGKLYFGSDDGHLYCVNAKSGSLLWKARGGPVQRKIVGNGRLISTWPVRGGPVLHDGVVYFTAGIWPFMGIFVHAVDAETGRTIWINSSDSIDYQINPHDSPAFGGFVPRGHLAVTPEGLLAPGGRTPPGLYDLSTGRLANFKYAKKGGRSVHGPVPIQAGSRKFTPADGRVTAGDWEGRVEGAVWTLLAADDKLFVVTVGGRIYCFGEKQAPPIQHALTTGPPHPDTKGWQSFAEKIAGQPQYAEGYALVFGLGTGGLAEALARASKLHLIAIDPDEAEVSAFRRRMCDAGLYGTRVVALVGDPANYRLAPYLANLVISEDLGSSSRTNDSALAAAAYRALRPYGGMGLLPVGVERLQSAVAAAKLAQADVKPLGTKWSALLRPGPLPGAADWTHNYADAANSVVSQDTRVKLPLGLLWFGGPSNDDVLPRHGHGPSPQVAGGRLFIEGPDMLRATDIYTGRLLWQRDLPRLGEFHNVLGHQPGAGEIGSNYVSLQDAVYVIYGETILELDPATGQTRREIKLEPSGDSDPANWGSLHVSDDLLIASSQPAKVLDARGRPNSVAKPQMDSGEFTALVKPNDRWRYLAGSDPDNGWTAASFDDSGWPTGEAGFGYGDDDDRTVIDMQDKFLRVYLRKTFDASALDDVKTARLQINYDDAFIAYLNGREIARAGIKTGRGKSASRPVQHEAKGFESFEIKDFGTLLQSGENVLAVEGHNRELDSSDFSLDPRLLVKRAHGASSPKPASTPPSTTGIVEHFVPVRYSSASRRLVALDRGSAEVLWQREAVYGFRHNNIAVAAGKVFCIDGLSPSKLAALQRRGIGNEDYRPQLLALDAHTGGVVWSTDKNVFGTFLNYSKEHDVLLQAGSQNRDRASDEVGTGMVTYRGADGEIIWQDLARSHAGPCMLHGDTIITQGAAYSLLTGRPASRKHPLTGRELPWKFTRNYGCNTAVAGQNLLTFRSAAAGFCDLAGDGGTGNFGGFKSSCTSNLIIAGGLLNAPDYTRTCTCNYQNQTSLAMIHDPLTEMWTFNALDWDGSPVRQAGLNFGAPGDRRGSAGTLWLDHPSVGGLSPKLPVSVTPKKVEYVRHHSSLLAPATTPGGPTWVAASAVVGVREIRIGLSREDEGAPRAYRVRLVFAELQDAKPGERVIDVFLQDKKVVDKLDLAERVGPMTAFVVEVADVAVSDELTIRLAPHDGSAHPPILSGVEIVAQSR